MRQVTKLIGVISFLGAFAFASIFGSVRGVIHDPQHRPIQGAHITLKAQNSDWTRSSDSRTAGNFNLPPFPSAITPSPCRRMAFSICNRM